MTINSISSLKYSEPFTINESILLRVRTFSSKGFPVGFTNEVEFTKVEKVTYPSWLATLLAGKYNGETVVEGKTSKTKKALQKEVKGALLINIADDPDLIDATGGYNFGCYIESLNPKKGQMWLDAGLKKDWVIQKLNKHKISNIAHLV